MNENVHVKEEYDGDLLIRPYHETDHADVAALWREAFPDDPPWSNPDLVIKRKLAVQGELFLVGERRHRIVASVLAGYDGVRGWIYHLAVASTEHRLGYGRAMMAEAERRLRELGCPKVNLQVRVTNDDVVKFYRALGYVIEERISMGKRLE